MIKLHVFKVTIVTILISICISGCREIKTTSQIFSDGSCERIVILEGDSSDIADTSFPIPRDSSWTIIFEKLTGHSRQFKYSAKKTFQTVSKLNEEFSSIPDTLLQVRIEVNLKKSFKWFNTHFFYMETYKTCNPFLKIPISNYMNGKEILLYFENEDTLDLKQKFENWFTEAVFAEFYQGLLQKCKSIQNGDSLYSLVMGSRDTLYNILILPDFFNNAPNDTAIIEQCRKIFNHETLLSLEDPIKSSLYEIDQKIAFMTTVGEDNYMNTVIMPGFIIDTNAKIMEGNQVKWEDENMDILFKDYIMWVESRIINKWAYGMTGGFIIIILFALIIPLFYKRNI